MGYTITDNNGVHIVSLGKSINLCGIGFVFDFPDMYCEKPDPLKIECGKHYKTRDRRKACVCFYTDNSYVGVIENDAGFARRWLPNGKAYHSSEFDLVSEWKEDK